jgi:hypothetical protein
MRFVFFFFYTFTGLFGTGAGKYADLMCSVQLDVIGGVYPMDRPEKYVTLTVPKSEVQW